MISTQLIIGSRIYQILCFSVIIKKNTVFKWPKSFTSKLTCPSITKNHILTTFVRYRYFFWPLIEILYGIINTRYYSRNMMQYEPKSLRTCLLNLVEIISVPWRTTSSFAILSLKAKKGFKCALQYSISSITVK